MANCQSGGPTRMQTGQIGHVSHHLGYFLGTNSLEESLSITTLRCDLAIATHARKMH